MAKSVVVFEYRWRSYALPLEEARAIRDNLEAMHPEQVLLIEAVGNSISGGGATTGLHGYAAQAVWDAMKPMAPPHGTPSPPFDQLYVVLKAVLG